MANRHLVFFFLKWVASGCGQEIFLQLSTLHIHNRTTEPLVWYTESRYVVVCHILLVTLLICFRMLQFIRSRYVSCEDFSLISGSRYQYVWSLRTSIKCQLHGTTWYHTGLHGTICNGKLKKETCQLVGNCLIWKGLCQSKPWFIFSP